MKPKVLVTRKLPPATETELASHFDVTLNASDVPYTGEEICALSKGMDALLVCHVDSIKASVIAGLSDSIKIIATFSTGTEHIDIPAATAREIVVANTPGAATISTAEVAIMLMLCAAHRANEGNGMMRRGEWEPWAPTGTCGVELRGKTLGIVGMGRIGRAVATIAKAMGMNIAHYAAASSFPDATVTDSVQELFSISDVISFHCPATPDTYHLINEQSIKFLKDGAIVVNAARGSVICDDALLNALRSGKVAAAGLDVFESEPNVNAEYRSLPNTFLLPHWGGATIEARLALGAACISNLKAYFSGSKIPGRVN